jgi:hypothetical protein
MALKTISLAVFSFSMFLGILTSQAPAQTRDEKVRNDRKKIELDTSWYYDDLDKGIEAAKKSKRPLMVVLRCIP